MSFNQIDTDLQEGRPSYSSKSNSRGQKRPRDTRTHLSTCANNVQLGQYTNNASPVPPINCECERLVHDEKHGNGMYISIRQDFTI